jgi:nucleotide-binding universal stress UspA family protein
MDHAELVGLMVEQRREQLTEDVERLRLSSPVSVRVTHGNPAFELVRHAVRAKHDLIVKAARGRDVKHMTSFGSTALHLVRKSPVPVMLMSADRSLLEAPKVLCALELDDMDARQSFNRSLLNAAASLASVYGAELHVVHVLDSARASVYRAFLSSEAFETFCRDRQQQLATQLEGLVATELSGGAHLHVHLLDGDPADRLVDLVRARRMSHLVMGSVTRQARGLMMGGLAEEVLTRVDCSVMTLKPSGFTTPIEVDVSTAA